MAGGDPVQRLAGGNHQHLDGRQAVGALAFFGRHQLPQQVEALQQFDITLDVVDEGAVEHVSGDLRQAGAGAGRPRCWSGLALIIHRVATDPDHQHARGAQVQGRADGCGLAYRAIAKVLAVDLYRLEDQRNGGAGEQMGYPQAGRHTYPTMAQPWVDGRMPLIERHRLGRLVAKCRHCYRAQLPLAEGRGDAGKIQFTLEQPGQWRTVEQRNRHLLADTEHAVAEEAAGLAQHAGPVAAVHLIGMKTAPNAAQPPHRLAKMQGAAGEADRIDRARRGADDHRKRIARRVGQQIGDGRQHTNLIGPSCAAAGEDQPCGIWVFYCVLGHRRFQFEVFGSAWACRRNNERQVIERGRSPRWRRRQRLSTGQYATNQNTPVCRAAGFYWGAVFRTVTRGTADGCPCSQRVAEVVKNAMRLLSC